MTEILPLSNLTAAANRAAASTEDAPATQDARDKSNAVQNVLSREDQARRLDSIRGGVITIGNFDGVHLGHAALLGQVRQLAGEMRTPAVAIVLDPHPAAILRPTKVPARLTWIERRAELMDPLGIDALVVCQTTKEFLKLTAEEFFQSLVVGRLGAAAMVEGPNFFFGRDRGGDIQVLKNLCRANEIELRIAEPTSVDDQMISSTRIRGLLEAGQVDDAAGLLGGPHRLRGKVVAGARRGRQIGFPTANLTDIDVVVPAPGVYAGLVHFNEDRYQAAVHIGPNPTFDDDTAVKVEVHLLDYDGDLYGQWLQVDFITRVRDIARFDSADLLVEQLERDIESIRSSLASYRNPRD